MGFGNLAVGRVISEYKEAYKVKNTEGEYLAKVTGRQIFEAESRLDYPVVGDWVAIREIDNGRAMIEGMLPRKTMIKRRWGDKNKRDEKSETQVMASNIDVVFIVESVDRDYNLNRLERYMAIVLDGGASPVIVLNKVDLISDDELDKKIKQIRERLIVIEIVITNLMTINGLDQLKKCIKKGKTYCFLGSSGVGKSSMINGLLGEDRIKTGDISSVSGRGKHVTTRRDMYFLENGGIVIDNPGMREVGLTDTNDGVDDLFDEISVLGGECKYADCTHMHEPGCAVIKALESEELDKEKYANFLNLKKEVEYYGMTRYERRQKKRQFGRYIKKVKKHLKDRGSWEY